VEGSHGRLPHQQIFHSWVKKLFGESIINHILRPPYSPSIIACNFFLSEWLKYSDSQIIAHLEEEGQRKHTVEVLYIFRENLQFASHGLYAWSGEHNEASGKTFQYLLSLRHAISTV
jgi:hypothetical protein